VWIEEQIKGLFASSSGVNVSHETAMRLSAVYGCVRVLSGDIGSAPLFLYRKQPDGSREPAEKHPLFGLLHDEPNEYMDSRTWRVLGQKQLELRGNFYNYIERDGFGNVRRILPLAPDTVTVGVGEQGQVFYDARWLSDNETRRYIPSQIFHVIGIPDDTGLVGISPIQSCRDTVGLGKAAEDYMARFFSNDCRPRGVIEVEGKIAETPEQSRVTRDQMRADWSAMYGGDNRHAVAILDQKTKFTPIAISPEDAQTIATRAFQVEEIAGRIFGVPPFMIGATDKTTSWGTGIAEQKEGYVTFSLLPRMTAWEYAIKRQLLQDREKAAFFAGFVMEGLLRASIEKRYAAYQIARQGGWISANEIRRLDNMNPLPADIGDQYWRPSNMVDAGQKISPEEQKVSAARAMALGLGGNGYDR
jgi:HK97 family phage portal protein